MIKLFVSGTGTDAGKTACCGFLARHFLSQGQGVRYLKPVQTGHPPDDDPATVRRISGLAEHRARLLFSAPEPVAPCFAFEPFPFAEAVAAIQAEPACDVLLIEGAGGLLSPLDREHGMFELARACGLPVLLVARNRLGCLNDILLSTHFLASSGLPLAGIALNEHPAPDPSSARNAAFLKDLLAPTPLFAFDASGFLQAPSFR